MAAREKDEVRTGRRSLRKKALGAHAASSAKASPGQRVAPEDLRDCEEAGRTLWPRIVEEKSTFSTSRRMAGRNQMRWYALRFSRIVISSSAPDESAVVGRGQLDGESAQSSDEARRTVGPGGGRQHRLGDGLRGEVARQQQHRTMSSAQGRTSKSYRLKHSSIGGLLASRSFRSFSSCVSSLATISSPVRSTSPRCLSLGRYCSSVPGGWIGSLRAGRRSQSAVGGKVGATTRLDALGLRAGGERASGMVSSRP